MELDLTKVVVTLLTGLFGLLTVIVGKDRLKLRGAVKKEKDIVDSLSVYYDSGLTLELQTEMEDTGVDRAILFEGHDSGKLPNIKSPYYIKVLFPATRPNKGLDRMGIKERYKDIEVDSHYISMLLRVVTEKHVVFIVKTMAPCMLKDIYETELVTQSIVSFIGTKGNSLIYMSQATMAPDGFTPDQITQAKLAANRLRTLNK